MLEPVNDIVKEYPRMYKLTFFNKPRDFVSYPKEEKVKSSKPFEDSDDSIQKSISRSRAMIFDYVKCNDFDMFVTFTFDPEKVNRYNMTHCFSQMQKWLWSQQRKHDGELRYIIVPEHHKDGAIHFHALMGGLKHQLKKTNVISRKSGKRVYNLTQFTYGFTNVQRLDDDKQKTTAYICKYIGKEFDNVVNRRRYWASKNLEKPVKFYNKMYDWKLFPDLQHQVFANDALAIYEIPKTRAELFD